ncbi:response regulator [Lacinutrix sp. Hel_I_90]|uniref:response regulator n=1 Tax=Lacinutrix sp. Hel_I_90 TaxID=1249999 RepID=UPI0005CB7B3C|nr:response regulator [Lacinutrix sp. Hel_I_90]
MKKEIFIIDDDPIYTMIVSMMINDIDASLPINECKNGEIGLEKLEKIKNAKHEVIVLLDINMPVLNGWNFLETIEKHDFYKLPQLLIVMVSSSVDESDILRSQQYKSVSSFYHKPLEKKDLKTILGLD